MILSNDAWLFILIFIIGFISLAFSRKWKLPEPLILFFLGIGASYIVDSLVLEPFIILALILLLFDAGTHFIPRKFSVHSLLIGEFVILSLILNSIIAGFLLYLLIFNEITALLVLLAIIAGSLISACSQFELLRYFKMKKNRLYFLTELEDHLSNPIALIVAIVSMVVLMQIRMNGIFGLIDAGWILIIDIAVGVFFGLITLYVIVRLLRRKYMRFVTVAFALFTYFAAVELGGVGFFSVIVLSMFFHNVTTRMPDMGEYSPIVTNIVYVFIFITMGYAVDFSISIIAFSMLFVLLYLMLRFVLLHIYLKKHMLFMTLDCPKGLAIGGLALMLMLEAPSVLVYNLMSALIIAFVICTLLSYLINVATKDIIV
jgi:hypothetical protein